MYTACVWRGMATIFGFWAVLEVKNSRQEVHSCLIVECWFNGVHLVFAGHIADVWGARESFHCADEWNAYRGNVGLWLRNYVSSLFDVLSIVCVAGPERNLTHYIVWSGFNFYLQRTALCIFYHWLSSPQSEQPKTAFQVYKFFHDIMNLAVRIFVSENLTKIFLNPGIT